MKSFVAIIVFLMSLQASAGGFTRNEKIAFFSKMPEMLKEYYDDNAIQACISDARNGSNEAFSALVVISHAKKAIDLHMSKMSDAVSNSKNKDEIYEKTMIIYRSKNLQDNMRLLIGMPKAIKYCNSLVPEANR